MSDTTGDELRADLEEAMRDVVDPELGINVVDLGLVYGLNVEEADGGTVALIDMTLTSAACPLTDVIEDQSRNALVWSTRSRSIGCGTRPGARTRSPRTAGNNCARWVSRFSRQSLSSLWALASVPSQMTHLPAHPRRFQEDGFVVH